MKTITLITTIILVTFLYSLSVTAQENDTKSDTEIEKEVVLLEEKIEKLKADYDVNMSLLVTNADTLKKDIEKYNKSRKSLTDGLSGLGKVEKIKLLAERYGMELQARNKIEEKLNKLFDLIHSFNKINNDIKEVKKVCDLKKTILELKNPETPKDAGSLNKLAIDKIQYFTVKEPTLLKDISSDKYGDPIYWNYIFKANSDKLKDPTIPVPKGTVLVIPDLDELKDNNESINY